MYSTAAALGAIVFLASLLTSVAPLRAQEVVRAGAGVPTLDERIDRLLDNPATLVLTRDTLVATGDTTRRPVLVLGSRLTLSGVVTEDIVAVDANLFLRPNAVVLGDVINIAGGYYPSALATVRGQVIDRPLAPYEVVREEGVVRVIGRARADPLVLDGFYGFHPPTYNRVDALTLQWGAAYLFPAFLGTRPRLHGRVGYRSARGAWTGGLELAFTRGATTLTLGAEKTTATNDEWIKTDLRNSLGFLWDGDDYRNYNLARRVWAGIGREFAGRDWRLELGVRGQLEEAETLEAGSPWTILDRDTVRPNPPVFDGRISSAFLVADGSWTGASAAFEGGVRLEFAGEVLGGERSYAMFVIDGVWSMAALFNHRLELEWHFQGPLFGTGSLPSRRRTFFGRHGPIQTFPIVASRGGRLVWLATEYTIPLPFILELPLVGAPELKLLHGIGTAWTAGTEPELEQNIGAALELYVLFLRIAANPENPSEEWDFDIGLQWPFGEIPAR